MYKNTLALNSKGQKGENKMKTQEFGEVVVLFDWEQIPPGMVLREAKCETVVLEEHYGNGDSDILHTFEKCNLSRRHEFAECIKIAREYAESEDTPIYVASSRITNIPQDAVPKMENVAQRYTCMECAVEWKQRHPWSPGIPKEKCEKCLKLKKSE